MTLLLHLRCSLSIPSVSSSLHHPNRPPTAKQRPITTIRPNNLPARDRVIDFGKHKGRMLGSLPSAYLLWVSKTLRAGDSLHWAELADQVLADPIYKDRIEWESAERVLSGGNNANTLPRSSAVSSLLEMSERFGWDNEDRAGWARVDFGLLGTSKGGRIPRKKGEGLVRRESGKREERRERRRSKRGEEVTWRGKSSSGGLGSGNPFPGRGALLDKIRRRENEI